MKERDDFIEDNNDVSDKTLDLDAAQDNDRFTYKPGDVEVANSICHFCEHYNNGQRSEFCSMKMIDDILKGQMVCPNFKITK